MDDRFKNNGLRSHSVKLWLSLNCSRNVKRKQTKIILVNHLNKPGRVKFVSWENQGCNSFNISCALDIQLAHICYISLLRVSLLFNICADRHNKHEYKVISHIPKRKLNMYSQTSD